MGTRYRKRHNKKKSGKTKDIKAKNKSCGFNTFIEPQLYVYCTSDENVKSVVEEIKFCEDENKLESECGSDCQNDKKGIFIQEHDRKVLFSDTKICQNEDLVDTYSSQPQDLDMEGQSMLNIVLQPPLLNRKFCSYEEQKMYKNFYGDKICQNIRNEILKESFVHENTGSLHYDMSVTESGSKHKLCLLYSRPMWENVLTMLVIEVDKDGLLGQSFGTLSLPWRRSVGFGSLGLKCYVIGGDALEFRAPLSMQSLPKEVFVCDLSSRVMSWEKGPVLNGGKPNPIVVTVNCKLYALAGYSYLWSKQHEEEEKYMFEVFDPECGTWRILPNPPFFYQYKEGKPQFEGHTVIGSVIYLQIRNFGSRTLYAFNVDLEQWSEYDDDDNSFSSPGSDDLVLHNLRVGDWAGRHDIVDYLMFRTSGHEVEDLNVYAYDLTSKIEICEDSNSDDETFSINEEENLKTEVREDNSSNDDSKRKKSITYDSSDFISERYYLNVVDDLVTVPVLGLTLIERHIPYGGAFSSFVTHLGDNFFALVCTLPYSIIGERLYESEHCWRLRICIFEASFIELSDGTKLEERYVAAYNVKEVKWAIPEMESFLGWCNVPNDGCQSQFRRPQKQYGTKSNPYRDRVAGQFVHKKNTFHRYVRRVNLPQY